MDSEEAIVAEIESVVRKYGPGRYGMWLIGTTDDEKALKKLRPGTLTKTWHAESDETAARIAKLFVGKGMSPIFDTLPGAYVYVC